MSKSRKTQIEVTPQPINPKHQIHPTRDPDSPNRVLIPTNIEEAVAELEKMLHPEFLDEIRTMSQSQFVASQHFGLSMWMRGAWGLWHENSLTQQLKFLGVTHPDGMSSFLLIALWHHLQQQPNG